MEIKFLQTRITKLTMILIKIALMGLIMTGIILINKKYMSNANGSERMYQNTSSEKLTTSEEIQDVGLKLFYK
jgi:hypothetical protein